MTMRPNAAEGIVIIGGQTFQLSKPAASTVLLPAFDRYDALRDEIREFVKKAIEGAETVSQMGLLETMEVFSLVYDPNAAKFYLSLCYADGKVYTLTYDKFEYCDWKDGDTDETVKWTIAESPQTSSTTLKVLYPLAYWQKKNKQSNAVDYNHMFSF